VRDLGVIVDSTLKFDQHISAVVHKAHTRTNLILKCFSLRDRVLLTKAFCTYVRPVMNIVPLFGPLSISTKLKKKLNECNGISLNAYMVLRISPILKT